MVLEKTNLSPTVVLEKTLESPLDCKEIQPVHPKGNQSWIFIGRTDAEVEASVLWPPDAKNWLIGKDPDAGKDWRQEEKGMTEDEMVRWHHRHYGHEFEQTLRVGDGQESLAYCSLWDHKELDTTEWQNWTDKILSLSNFRCIDILQFLFHRFCSDPYFLNSTSFWTFFFSFSTFLKWSLDCWF